jgi:hypothetical protein
MAIHRAGLLLRVASAGILLLSIAANCSPVTGVTTANLGDETGRGSQSSISNSKKSTSNQKSEPEPQAAKLPAPPETWQEHWSKHDHLLKLVAWNDDAVMYFDDAMPRRGIAWMVPFVTSAWQYTKKTYGKFGPDPRVYAIFHQGKYGGGHPSTYFDDSHDHRNVTDCGLDNWDRASIDFVSHEMGHIVEGSNNDVEESPAFEIWKDSKWIEFYQYDLYMALGLRNDARRIYEKWSNQTDDPLVPGLLLSTLARKRPRPGDGEFLRARGQVFPQGTVRQRQAPALHPANELGRVHPFHERGRTPRYQAARQKGLRLAARLGRPLHQGSPGFSGHQLQASNTLSPD